MHRMVIGLCIVAIALAGVGSAGVGASYASQGGSPSDGAVINTSQGPSGPQGPPGPQVPSRAEQDGQRAERELRQAKERLPDVATFARTNEDTRVLFTMARRNLALAEAHFEAGRYYQAAEVAVAVVKMSEAIRHLYWAQARPN